MVIPSRTRNLNETNVMHEGALTTAAIEAAKLLWSRHAPMGDFEVKISRIESSFYKNQTEDVRVRLELPETTREMVLSALRTHREAKAEAEVKIFDDHDQAVADLHLHLNFTHTPALAGQTNEA